jgi:hypothetical protein
MLGIFLIASAIIGMAKIAEAERRSPGLWAGFAALTAFLFSLLLGSLYGGIAAIIIPFSTMFILNFRKTKI